MALKHQSGITLVVVLVILIAMTFLGLGAMSDSNLQLHMVRNTQLQNMVHSASLTEINAQIDSINTNDTEMEDLVIRDVLQSPTNQLTSDDGLFLFTPQILGNQVSDGLEQDLTLTQLNPGVSTQLTVGFSSDSDVQWRYFEFASSTEINGTASASNQTQGFRYLLPSAN